jgi:hypothetical protein
LPQILPDFAGFKKRNDPVGTSLNTLGLTIAQVTLENLVRLFVQINLAIEAGINACATTDTCLLIDTNHPIFRTFDDSISGTSLKALGLSTLVTSGYTVKFTLGFLDCLYHR